MDRIHITGGAPLNGTIPISGAKNAALPLMIASLMTGETLELINVPRLADITALLRILGNHGVDQMVVGKRPGQTSETGQTIRLTASNIIDTTAPYDLVSTMRASFWVIAPLLARFGEAKVSLPGGCAIGTRPVDLLIMALQQLGAETEIDGGYVIAKTKKGLRGGQVSFPKVTVGGTHVALMAARAGLRHERDRERRPRAGGGRPRRMPQQDGRADQGRGHAAHRDRGRGPPRRRPPRGAADRIETGTYAMAVAMTGGDVILKDTRADLLHSALDVLATTGTEITPVDGGIRVRRNGGGIAAVDVTTDPFPGFPTDLQAQFMALMTLAKGQSHIRETIFENRFMHVQELARLGAKIRLDGDMAIVEGVDRLRGAPVMATDLRASVSLVIAGLAAEGETQINRVYHLDRGFEALEAKLNRCGAQIERVRG